MKRQGQLFPTPDWNRGLTAISCPGCHDLLTERIQVETFICNICKHVVKADSGMLHSVDVIPFAEWFR